MNDTVQSDIRLVAPQPVVGTGQSRLRAGARRLKRLGAEFGDAWREIAQGMQAARKAHPVISAYRPR